MLDFYIFDFVCSDPKLHVRRGSDPIIPIINGDPQKWNDSDPHDVDSNANTLPEKVRIILHVCHAHNPHKHSKSTWY